MLFCVARSTGLSEHRDPPLPPVRISPFWRISKINDSPGIIQAIPLFQVLFTHSLYLFSLQVHRLVVVNDQMHVKGVISLSDVLKYLVLTSHTDT